MIPNFKKVRAQYLGSHANLSQAGEYILFRHSNMTSNIVLDIMTNYNANNNTAMRLCISCTYKGSSISLLSLKENLVDTITRVDVLTTSDGLTSYIALYYNRSSNNNTTYRAEFVPRVSIERKYDHDNIARDMHFTKQEDLGITLTTQSTLTIG